MNGKSRHLERDEVIGRTIAGIRTLSEFDEREALDIMHASFVLDSGISFLIDPCEPRLFTVTDYPTWKVHRTAATMQRIAGVWCEFDETDGEMDPLSIVVELADGSFFYHNCVAPHGTGHAGVFFTDHADSYKSQLKDIWTREPFAPRTSP